MSGYEIRSSEYGYITLMRVLADHYHIIDYLNSNARIDKFYYFWIRTRDGQVVLDLHDALEASRWKEYGFNKRSRGWMAKLARVALAVYMGWDPEPFEVAKKSTKKRYYRLLGMFRDGEIKYNPEKSNQPTPFVDEQCKPPKVKRVEASRVEIVAPPCTAPIIDDGPDDSVDLRPPYQRIIDETDETESGIGPEDMPIANPKRLTLSQLPNATPPSTSTLEDNDVTKALDDIVKDSKGFYWDEDV